MTLLFQTVIVSYFDDFTVKTTGKSNQDLVHIKLSILTQINFQDLKKERNSNTIMGKQCCLLTDWPKIDIRYCLQFLINVIKKSWLWRYTVLLMRWASWFSSQMVLLFMCSCISFLFANCSFFFSLQNFFKCSQN